jgi:hypothetical protein
MPTYTVWLFFESSSYLKYSITENAIWLIYLFVFLNTALLPLLTILFLYKMKQIKSLHLHSQSDRVLPVIAAVIYYGFTYYLLQSIHLPNALLALIEGAIYAIISALIITKYFKISLHTTAIGGVCGGFWAISLFYENASFSLLALLPFAVGIVASARLLLQAHNSRQVYAGAVIGFILVFFTILFRIG